MVFNNENNDLNPLTAYYFSFMVHVWMFIGFLIHLCWFYFQCIFSTNYHGPVYVCLFWVGNRGIGVECGIWSELVMKTPQRRHSGVFVVCSGHICFCNIQYSQSFWKCSTFIFFNAIFICSYHLLSLSVWSLHF